MRRVIKSGTSTIALSPRLPVADGEARGADDRPLSRGNIVRRPERHSPSMGVVASDMGKVVDIFRRAEEGPVLIDVMRDASAACGLATWLASDARRSQAGWEGWDA